MNSNKTQWILFVTPNFNERTETFQKIIDDKPDTVKHMEDKSTNLGVILDSRLSLDHHIKSLCSRLNETLAYLNRVIIIIKIGGQCKAERESYMPHQSEYPSPTIPTYRQEEEKGKISRRL